MLAKNQIKTKKRVKDFGEVFTNEREVNSMLDLVRDESYNITSTFFEPCCGDGNFLINILQRKIYSVMYRYSKNKELFEIYSLLAFSTIYGVDIQEDNVIESKNRLLNWYKEAYYFLFQDMPSSRFLQKILFVMNCNIQCGNSLTCQLENGNDLLISEWILLKDYRLKRKQFRLKDMTETDNPKQVRKSVIYNWFYAHSITSNGGKYV